MNPRHAILAALAALPLTVPVAADAQTRNLGNTPQAISQALERFGYAPQFRMIDREIVRTVVEACRGRDMFRVSVNLLGAVKTKERRGRCDIPGAVAAPARPAPQDDTRLATRQLVESLARRGFTDVRPTARRGPRPVFRVCDRQGRRLDLTLNRRGDILNDRLVGRCDEDDNAAPSPRPFARADVEALLEREGFESVRVQSDRAPFGAVGCRDGRRERVIVDRRGRIVARETVGRCRDELTAEAVRTRLEEQGFKRVEVTPRGRRFDAAVCDGTAKLALRLDRGGRIVERERDGRCASREVGAVLDRLNKRGGRRLELFVEGCFRGDRYRWSFDALGERTGRERIGEC